MNKKRVLILSTSAGTGHVKAGEALEKVFAADPRVEAVEHRDALQYTNQLFRDFYSKLYLQLVRSAPGLLGWFYDTSDEPWKTDTMRLRLDRLNTGPLVKFIHEFQPHITVCTHFMPSGIISHLLANHLISTHHSIVVTDFDMHAMWLSRTFHRYFVAIDETRAHLETLGLPPERITVSGIPVDPAFSLPVDREKIIAELGLDPAKPTLLLSAGALGVSPTEMVVSRLKELQNPAQTIVICGRSEETKARVETLVAGHPNFKILGYTDRMPEFMQIAQLFIGKPGGLTTSEALACGLPMVIISPIPGQEERNSDHLLEEGAAIKCNEFTTIPYKVDKLLGDPAHLAGMSRRAAALGRPRAAWTVVETLMADELPPLQIDKVMQKEIASAAAREQPKPEKALRDGV
jgi:processive 1,2-diacylglycerol beta-glucosyltransferase